jgi:hypothetical protein
MKLEAYIDLYKYNFVYCMHVHVVPSPRFQANKRQLLGQMKLLVSIWRKVLVIFVCEMVYNCILGCRGVARVCVGTGECHCSMLTWFS